MKHLKQAIKAFYFLQEHNLSGRWRVNLLLDVVDIKDFGQLVVDLLRHSLDILFFVHGTCGSAVAGLHFKGVKPEGLGCVGEVGDLGVRVEAEDAGACEERDFVNGKHVSLHVISVRDCVVAVSAREVELPVLIEDELTKELLKVSIEDTAIPVISDTTTIVDDTGNIDQGFPRDFLLLIQEDLQHGEGGVQV